jgi:hypothetical protein
MDAFDTKKPFLLVKFMAIRDKKNKIKDTL